MGALWQKSTSCVTGRPLPAGAWKKIPGLTTWVVPKRRLQPGNWPRWDRFQFAQQRRDRFLGQVAAQDGSQATVGADPLEPGQGGVVRFRCRVR